MSSAAQTTPELIGQARKLVGDLFTPNPLIFWADFLISLTIGYAAAGIYLHPDVHMFSGVFFTCYFVAAIALFRVSLFMHEIVHFRRGEMTSFKVAWNILAGIPMLIPSFLYESHLAHHNTHHYGTGNDGEYLPLGVARLRTLLAFLAQIAILPILVTVRFLIFTPISFLHPKLRTWFLERASSFVVNFAYRRAIPDNAPRATWAALEIACFLRTLGIFSFLVVSEVSLFGETLALTWLRVPKLYLLAMMTLGLNHIRTLVAHRYRSVGERFTFAEQFDDSVNVTGRTPFVEFLFPVGLRYHALHHLFPSIPYHSLGTAHRRLIKDLPADSAYHRATYNSFWQALRELIRSARESCATPPPGADLWFDKRRRESQPTLPEMEDTTESVGETLEA